MKLYCISLFLSFNPYHRVVTHLLYSNSIKYFRTRVLGITSLVRAAKCGEYLSYLSPRRYHRRFIALPFIAVGPLHENTYIECIQIVFLFFVSLI